MSDPKRLLSTPQDLAAIQIIRTETVLSKLPIHNLSKTGDFEIVINKGKAPGEVELHWAVSYNAKYGPPRQLAYKLDTLLINRRIDELGKPVPRFIRLGSLREMARQLDLGGDTNQIRKALRQNAFTGISAKLHYRSTDGANRSIEADFTRYSVVFAGEKLPDGREADVVHLVLSEPYLEVLNHAPVRPLNYDYLKQLTPAAQRFYEIVSYRIYAAIKYGHTYARLPYSDFCMCSALQRYSDYDHFKKQMYKIHRPHLESGYIQKVLYQENCDGDGAPDWTMMYLPGDRARQEYEAFHRKRQAREAEKPCLPPDRQEQLLEQLTRRGVAAVQARRLLASVNEGQAVQEQLDWGDYLIARSRTRIQNPPGFYAYLVRENIAPSEDFQRRRRIAGQGTELPAPEVESAYEEYRRKEVDHYLAARYSAEEYEQLIEARGREVRKQYRFGEAWSKENLREVAEGVLRAEAARQINLLNLSEFRDLQKRSD